MTAPALPFSKLRQARGLVLLSGEMPFSAAQPG
jgi:hypothetical protein